MDAAMGYYQINLADSSKDLTCFITPWGRYRFNRAVMGLVSAGDEYNRRGDQALGDVPRTIKVVDDILAYDATYAEHLVHIIHILQKSEAQGITLNARKFQFGRSSVDFCGYHITRDGYTVDRRKTSAISEFPRPQNITDLRSFPGLATQLSSFSTEVAREAAPLRDLLKPRNTWLWTPVHEDAFNRVKSALSSPPILSFFDSTLPTVLCTDAARTGGLGYALLQCHGHQDWKLVQCGSRFLSDV